MEEALNTGVSRDGTALIDTVPILGQRQLGIVNRRVLVVLPFEVSALGAHVGDAQAGVLDNLMFDGKVPILGIR